MPRRSPFWYAVYEAPNGKRVFVSTKCRDKDPAWKFALKLQEASDKAKHNKLNEERIQEIVSSIAGKPSQGFTVRGWFTHWLEIKGQTRSDKTLDRYRQVVRDFLKSLGDRADTWMIHHITSQDILRYRTHIRKTGRTAHFRYSAGWLENIRTIRPTGTILARPCSRRVISPAPRRPLKPRYPTSRPVRKPIRFGNCW